MPGLYSDCNCPILNTVRILYQNLIVVIDPIIGVPLETAIGCMVKRSYTALGWSDSCIHGTGGYSTEYRVWFHVEWPTCIYEKATKFTKEKDAITINDLEFISVILDFIAALVAMETNGLGEDKNPVMLLYANNMSAISWVSKFA
jgi:hypothetical protein